MGRPIKNGLNKEALKILNRSAQKKAALKKESLIKVWKQQQKELKQKSDGKTKEKRA
jgi:predicted GIY-YIG superfamily endonuclease